jgi:hypothetical protein
MCGIAGLLDLDARSTPTELHEQAARMADVIRHRGPDDHGTWADPSAGVAFGHQRLAIIDLSDAGHQPMTSSDRRWTLTFNGELYNFPELRRDLEAGGVRFRWHFLRGRLAPFDGETTPRNFSPCGVTIDRSAVVLARHPERVYDWIGVELAEVLLVPLNVGMGEPVGTLWVATETEDHFTRDDADVLSDLAECVGATVAEWRRLQPA